jgi:3-oxoacyl-[acyl-carrier protein] reductase
LSKSVSRKLEGRVALITGASGEIGSATAMEFAKEGAIGVALHYNRNRGPAEQILRRMKRLGTDGIALKADISRPDEAGILVKKTVARFGRLDALVCLAGHPFQRDHWFGQFEKLTPEQLKKPLRVDLLGNAFVVQSAIPVMRKQYRAKIVLIGSTPALTGDSVGISYLIAKAGILAMTRALAQYLGPSNINVNALALGSIETRSTTGHLTARERKQLAAEAALKRFGTPQEIAREIVFLVSDDSDFITGQTIVADGGYAMR